MDYLTSDNSRILIIYDNARLECGSSPDQIKDYKIGICSVLLRQAPAIKE